MSTGVKYVRFEVLMVVSMKIVVFWIIVPCSLVDVYRCFRNYFLPLLPEKEECQDPAGSHISNQLLA